MKRYNQTIHQKLHKDFCEICDCKDKETLHWHHIIDRVKVGTSNEPYNLSVVCSNCHNKIHAGTIEIIGVYPATNRYGRKLIYKLNSVANIADIEEPYFKSKPLQMTIPRKE